jgi:hypothetical protein
MGGFISLFTTISKIILNYVNTTLIIDLFNKIYKLHYTDKENENENDEKKVMEKDFISVYF